jgi:hypothetical protein
MRDKIKYLPLLPLHPLFLLFTLLRRRVGNMEEEIDHGITVPPHIEIIVFTKAFNSEH